MTDVRAPLDEWPELAPFFDETPHRAEVASWPLPWRRLFNEKVAAAGDEREAYEAVLELRGKPKETAGRLVGGGVPIKDPVAMPPMARRKPRKATREAMPSMFDGMEDEASTTYRREEK